MAFYFLANYHKALDSYNKAIEIKSEYCAGVYYYKACCLALQHSIELVIKNLQGAVCINPEKYRNRAKTNSDFDSIREDERFQELIQ
jgi:tetratricopeptide (TPR) repeat protein